MSLHIPISQSLSSNRNKNDELLPKQRALVLEDVDAGIKKTNIAARHNILRQAVYNTIKRYNETGALLSQSRAGRPQALNRAEKRAILRIVRRNPRCSYAALRTKCTATTPASHDAIYRHLKKHYITA
jgi:transposase